VDPELIEGVGAVSTEVAEALAEGIAERFDAELGVGITGIAGPGGGTAEKPVGLVCFSVWMRAGEREAKGEAAPRRLTRRSVLPGSRSDIRDRSVTVAMHMLRRVLLGESDEQPAPAAGATPAS
jgi:nicotinamide-nucleotide amidase